MRIGLVRAVGSCGLIFASGCALLPPSHYVAVQTPYYEDGQDQPEPPDGWLKPGTPVWEMMKVKNGYSKVILEDGTAAEISNTSLVTRSRWEKEQDEKEKKAAPASE